ncbi:hypothetical protein OE88DRAFT_1666652 [Heliocybe sulcata]|uniref:Uncharacterized protein n=1 Tax=Heliocybe sulcata TaxID=5364 RepID=A0A5C3N0K3_9AGAM|nr:hypothetical protein OE88DRAFT_1666652 [Heliocybe sulcata]
MAPDAGPKDMLRPAKRPRLSAPLPPLDAFSGDRNPPSREKRPITFLSDFTTSNTKSDLKSRPLRPPQPPQFFDDRLNTPSRAKGKAQCFRTPLFIPHAEPEKSRNVTPAMKPMKAPEVFLEPPPPQRSKPSTSRLHPLSLPNIPFPTPDRHIPTTSTILRTHVPPALTPVDDTPIRESASLNSLLSFPRPVLSEPSTPRKPRTTPLTFLPDTALSPNPEPEPDEVACMVHGSPTKKRFLRAGLASLASTHLTRSLTSLSLWSKDTHPSPDLRLSVLRIAYRTPRAVFAICRQDNSRENEARRMVGRGDEETGGDGEILMAFLSLEGERQVKEGRDVAVWKPWSTVCLPTSRVLGDAGSVREAGAGEGGDGREMEVVLCSRYVVAEG